MEKFQPVIKWTGSKRSQCDDILKYFPLSIDTYYEPFCGGCSMLMGLMNSDIFSRRYVCSDINGDLIALWNKVKESPSDIFEKYRELWSELNKDNDIDRKRDFFETQRNIYNETHDPLVFFFIMRTTTNGMPRYNNSGKFNNSFHLNRNGIEPERVLPIINEWSIKLNRRNVQFIHRSYDDILDEIKPGDFIYMDPPYMNTNSMYYGMFDFEKFFNFIRNVSGKGVRFALSFNGKSGDIDDKYYVPDDCYKTHFYIKSGKSSFTRLKDNRKDIMVFESLYLNYDETDMF